MLKGIIFLDQIQIEKTLDANMPLLKDQINALDNSRLGIRFLKKIEGDIPSILHHFLANFTLEDQLIVLAKVLNAYHVEVKDIINKLIQKSAYDVKIGNIKFVNGMNKLAIVLENIEVNYNQILNDPNIKFLAAKKAGLFGKFALGAANIAATLSADKTETLVLDLFSSKLANIQEIGQKYLDEYHVYMRLAELRLSHQENLIEPQNLVTKEEAEDLIMDLLAAYLRDKL